MVNFMEVSSEKKCLCQLKVLNVLFHVIYVTRRNQHLTLPKCHVLIDVGDHGMLPLSILRHSHQSGHRHLYRDISARLDPNFSLCLPLALLHSIITIYTSFSEQSYLSRCPKIFNCLFLTGISNSLLTHVISITLSLVTLALHVTLSILLKNHISTATSLLLNF